MLIQMQIFQIISHVNTSLSNLLYMHATLHVFAEYDLCVLQRCHVIQTDGVFLLVWLHVVIDKMVLKYLKAYSLN